VEWPSYGRPRIAAELRRRGWKVNPKRVYRLMREDNLLCLRQRKFVVTTDSNHTRKVYPNLARDMILTATDQLWRADITYIGCATSSWRSKWAKTRRILRVNRPSDVFVLNCCVTETKPTDRCFNHQTCQVELRSAQPIEVLDHNTIHPMSIDIFEEPLQCWALGPGANSGRG
jgi:transposase InsO family protein